MPQAAEQHGYRNRQKPAERNFAVPGNRNEQVVPQEAGKSHVPTLPEFPQVGRGEWCVEVEREA